MAAQDRDLTSFRCASMTLYEVQGDGFCLQTLHLREVPKHVQSGGAVLLRIDKDFLRDGFSTIYLPVSPVHAERFIAAYEQVSAVELAYQSMSGRREGPIREEVVTMEAEGFWFRRRSSKPGLVSLSVPSFRNSEPVGIDVSLRPHDDWRALFVAAYRHIVALDAQLRAERVPVHKPSVEES